MYQLRILQWTEREKSVSKKKQLLISLIWSNLNQIKDTLTSSTPMTPAPITIISSGTFFKDRAPVEDTMVSSSIYNETQAQTFTHV